MSNTTFKENIRKASQKGVALLFALGILGLLLVMALGFATNSIFDQLIATNSSNNASARVIANSGLERVCLMLQNYPDQMLGLTGALNLTTYNIMGYSHSDDATVYNVPAAASDMLSNADFFGGYTNLAVADPKWANINWIYLKSGNNITGRMAYIILNRADLDPGKLVKPNVDETLATETRLGAEANEINLTPVISLLPAGLLAAMPPTPALTTADIVRRCNYCYSRCNTQPHPGVFDEKWIDYKFMFRRIYDGDPHPLVIPALPGLMQFSPAISGANSLADYFQRFFIFNSKNSPEAFWIDKNADGKITQTRDAAGVVPAEQVHRFNLARTTWNTDFIGASTSDTCKLLYNKILLSSNATGNLPNVNIFQKPYTTASNNPAAYPLTCGSLWTEENFDGYGIPWLATFGMKDSTLTTAAAGITYPVWIDDDANFKETFASVKDRRHQIAANLVEYCRTPEITNIATHSAISDSSDWLTIPPTFTGNMKTPYINEIGGHVQVKTTIQANLPKYNISTQINFWLYSELINIYATAWPRLPSSIPASTLRLNVTGTFKYDYLIGKLAAKTGVTVPINIDVNAFSWSGAPGIGYATSIDTVASVPTSPAGETIPINDNNVPVGQVQATISNVSFTIDRAVLYEPQVSNVFYDYAGINQTSTLATLQNYNPGGGVLGAMADGTSISDTQDGWFSFETEDPRQNLNAGVGKDWTAKTAGLGAPPCAVWSAINNSGTVVGSVNTNSNPSDRHGTLPAGTTDLETATDPSNGALSTAFIRNAPMVSPWELGFIHRGARWQTLNLHKYDTNKKALAVAVDNGSGSGTYNIFSAGGGLYQNGDANILDQIKMNTYPKNYKLDISNLYQDPTSGSYVVIDTLLTNIVYGSTLTTVAPGITGGTGTLSAADISSIRNAIIYGNPMGAVPVSYSTRAQLVNNIAAVAPISGYATKAHQDEIIGKFINLVDFDSYFTVILISQTIKDIGGNGADITINKRLRDGTPPVSIQTRQGRFDMTNAAPYTYADEITSTVKVQALVHKKIDGTCEILSAKYLQ